jgi:hypothetical protein|tara:strand:- start:1930 stop:2277 length:348 start_codon:yes stop_codon:yes gene_type:complete
MATFAKIVLSASTDGRGVKVAATGTAGTTIHTAHASAEDEIWIFAYNSHTAPVVLTCEMGGATDPDDHIVSTIPYDAGVIQVVPGLLLTNSLVLKAFASVADKITLYGFVNRITA